MISAQRIHPFLSLICTWEIKGISLKWQQREHNTPYLRTKEMCQFHLEEKKKWFSCSSMYTSQYNYFKSMTQCVSGIWPNHYFYWKTDFTLTAKLKYFHINYCFKTYEIQCSWTEQNLITPYNFLCPWKIQLLLETESVKPLNSFLTISCPKPANTQCRRLVLWIII